MTNSGHRSVEPWTCQSIIHVKFHVKTRRKKTYSIHQYTKWLLLVGYSRMIWDDMGWYGMIWDDMGWYGMIWDDMGWYGMYYSTIIGVSMMVSGCQDTEKILDPPGPRLSEISWDAKDVEISDMNTRYEDSRSSLRVYPYCAVHSIAYLLLIGLAMGIWRGLTIDKLRCDKRQSSMRRLKDHKTKQPVGPPATVVETERPPTLRTKHPEGTISRQYFQGWHGRSKAGFWILTGFNAHCRSFKI